MLHAKFQDHRTSGSGKEDFKGFFHIWAWRPSWSCDLDHLCKLSLPLPKEAPHEIWALLVKRFKRRCLKIMVMYMYIAPGQGQTTPWGQFFSLTVLFSQFSPLLQVFLH